MNKGFKKFLMWGVPIIAGGGLIYWLNHRKKSTPPPPADDNDVKDAIAPATRTTSSVFPLKQGSKGDKVKELQRIIGTAADGIFGPNTENALISYAGVRIVPDQKALDELKNKAIGASNYERAKSLVDRFKQGGVSMYVIKDATAELVEVDTFGAIQYTSRFKTFAGGKVYSNTDYQLVSPTKAGNLLFTINKGTLLGTYMVDPNLISLK
jgi:hypothetical protein